MTHCTTFHSIIQFLRVILESKFIMEDLQHARKKMQARRRRRTA